MEQYIKVTFASLSAITRFVKEAKIKPSEVLDSDCLSAVYPLYILPYAETSDHVESFSIITL